MNAFLALLPSRFRPKPRRAPAAVPAAAFPVFAFETPRFRDSVVVGGCVIALHAAVIAAVIHFQPKPLPPVVEEQVITVNLTTPPQVIPEPPKPEPPAVKAPPPKTPPPPRARPVPAAPAVAPKPVAAPTLAIPEAVSTPTPAAAAVAAPPPPRAESAADAPVSEPEVDADYADRPIKYPAMSERLGEYGKVVLRVHVTPEGLADKVEVKSSSGFPRLDEAASEAVRHWRFKPARQGEKAVAAWTSFTIDYAKRKR